MNESEMDTEARKVLDFIRVAGPDCFNMKTYGQHGLDKGFYTQADIDEAANDFNLKQKLR